MAGGLDDEPIYVPEIDEILFAPEGTAADLKFLRECGVDMWDAYHFLTYMNGEHPFEMRGDETND